MMEMNDASRGGEREVEGSSVSRSAGKHTAYSAVIFHRALKNCRH